MQQNKITTQFKTFFTLTLSALFLVACGGGGGGQKAAPPVLICDAAPACETDNNCDVIGRVTFDRVPVDSNTGLDFNNTIEAPAQSVVVQLLDDVGNEIERTLTDSNGGYKLSSNGNSSVRVRALAASICQSSGGSNVSDSWNYTVRNNTNNNLQYFIETDMFIVGQVPPPLRARSGWGGSSYTSQRNAAPFAILDTILRATQFVADEAAQIIDFDALEIRWSADNIPANGNLADGEIGTSFYFQNQIYLLGGGSNPNGDSDEFDEDVVVHEWMHYFVDTQSRSDSPGGPHGNGVEDPTLAFDEGLAYAVAGIINEKDFSIDSGGPNGILNIFSLEDKTGRGTGWWSEGAITSLVYDLIDSANDLDDTVSLGLEPILDVLTGPLRTTDAMVTIFPFVQQLKSANSNSVAAINDLVNSFSIDSDTIDAFATTETNFPGISDNSVLPIYRVADLVGTPVEVCSTNNFGVINSLSNRRYVRVDIPVGEENYAITVTPSFNEDDALASVEVLKEGAFVVGGESEVKQQSLSLVTRLAFGTHVLVVYDVANVDGSAGVDVCYEVTVSGPV